MKKKKEKLAFGRLNLLRGDTLNGNKRINPLLTIFSAL